MRSLSGSEEAPIHSNIKLHRLPDRLPVLGAHRAAPGLSLDACAHHAPRPYGGTWPGAWRSGFAIWRPWLRRMRVSAIRGLSSARSATLPSHRGPDVRERWVQTLDVGPLSSTAPPLFVVHAFVVCMHGYGERHAWRTVLGSMSLHVSNVVAIMRAQDGESPYLLHTISWSFISICVSVGCLHLRMNVMFAAAMHKPGIDLHGRGMSAIAVCGVIGPACSPAGRYSRRVAPATVCAAVCHSHQ